MCIRVSCGLDHMSTPTRWSQFSNAARVDGRKGLTGVAHGALCCQGANTWHCGARPFIDCMAALLTAFGGGLGSGAFGAGMAPPWVTTRARRSMTSRLPDRILRLRQRLAVHLAPRRSRDVGEPLGNCHGRQGVAHGDPLVEIVSQLPFGLGQ